MTTAPIVTNVPQLETLTTPMTIVTTTTDTRRTGIAAVETGIVVADKILYTGSI